MPRIPRLLPALAALGLVGAPVGAQRIIPRPAAPAVEPTPPSYAETADLLDAAPLVIDVTVREADRVRGKDVPPPPPGTVRLLMTGDVARLIRGNTILPARVSWVWLAPLDAAGHPPKLRKAHLLLFARPVGAAGNQVQLVRRDAQRPWSAALDALVRRIATTMAAPDVPPVVTAVSHAFHVAGTLPGEGTTQIFLQTADHRPISLTVERAASGERHWSVALGDIVGAGAPPPARDTLLWFRLACFLPAKLPEAATADASADDATAAGADYDYVMAQLGPCNRGGPGT